MKNRLLTNRITIMILLILSILPFFIIGIYSRPCVDDFSYSNAMHKLVLSGDYNFFSLLKQAFLTDIGYYNSWQGLYSSAFILAWQPAIFSDKVYFIGSYLLILLMFLSILFLVKFVVNKYEIQVNSYVTSLLVVVLILCGVPDLIEGLYWYNGAWNYGAKVLLVVLDI